MKGESAGLRQQETSVKYTVFFPDSQYHLFVKPVCTFLLTKTAVASFGWDRITRYSSAVSEVGFKLRYADKGIIIQQLFGRSVNILFLKHFQAGRFVSLNKICLTIFLSTGLL
jgi:hypothetical protein